MKGAIIYFSGTGNTEFVAKLFRNEFRGHNIECSMIDISKKKKISDTYDFFVLGCPIYAEVFPDYFLDWVDRNLLDGKNRRCIVFSTQAADSGAGADILSGMLKRRGFNVVIQDFIKMPNNYYVVAFSRQTEEEKKALKEMAGKSVARLVEDFISNRTNIKRVSRFRQGYGKIAYRAFLSATRKWAKKRLRVDMDICVKCGKCVKNCPTQNISLNDRIDFKENCISCQRCLHCCPVNAFLYKEKGFEQYKI